MDEIKHQVFISSTYIDLKKERQAAVEEVLRAGHIPAGMELFTADDRSQLEVITSWIDESDIYIVILGTRYGSIEPTSKQSYTEYEYRYALKKEKPILGIVLGPEALDKKFEELKSEASDAPEQLRAFRALVMSKTISTVNSLDQIKLAVSGGIQTLRKNKQLGGWRRATRSAMEVASELARLSVEVARLQQELSKRAKGPDEDLYQKWATTLNSRTTGNRPHNKPSSTLLEAFLEFAPLLATGVSNHQGQNEIDNWLFGVASDLLSLGLAELAKVPPRVYWQRIQLSKEGKQVVAALNHLMAQNATTETSQTSEDSE